MLGGSLLWSYVAYGLVGVLVAFIVGLFVMMTLASKDDKKRNAALPLLTPEQAEEKNDEFIFASELDQDRTAVAPSSPKRPTRTFFKGAGGTDSKSTKPVATSTTATDASFFEQDEFDLTEGSDLNTPQ